MKTRVEQREKRHKRVRKDIFGTKDRPRVSVYKSNKNIYVQVIDDRDHSTIIGIKKKKTEDIGSFVAKEMTKKKIKKAVFDRGGYAYHGKVKKIAEDIRSEGIKI